MKKRRHSDYFDPHMTLTQECMIFLNHKSVNEWCRYTFDMGIIGLTNDTTEPFRVLDELEQDILAYTNWMIKELEGWEEYEMCDAVMMHRDRFIDHLKDIADRI